MTAIPDSPLAGALILDLDGVLRRWDPAIIGDAERAHDLPPGALARAAFGNEQRLHAAITGRLSDTRWRAGIAAELVGRYGPAASQAVEQWSQPCGALDPDVLEVVRWQRSLRPVVLLSNATDRLADDLLRLGLTGELDRVFNSWQLRVAKPDPAIFRTVCAELSVPPERCLFVDDSLPNVAAAGRVGLIGHHYRDLAGLVEFLNGWPARAD